MLSSFYISKASLYALAAEAVKVDRGELALYVRYRKLARAYTAMANRFLRAV